LDGAEVRPVGWKNRRQSAGAVGRSRRHEQEQEQEAGVGGRRQEQEAQE